MTDDLRRDRIARNEVLFREVNERVQEIAGGSVSDTVLLVCECGRADCTVVVVPPVQTLPGPGARHLTSRQTRSRPNSMTAY